MDKDQNRKELASVNHSNSADFVLDKDIFSNIFDKDIRRVYIYKKAERLAKALRMITPAFVSAPVLKDRIDGIAIALVDAAIQPPASARMALSRELLALSSLLSIARIGSMLSSMNADLIAREAQLLLQEIALYEEPRLSLDESPSLASIARTAGHTTSSSRGGSSHGNDPARGGSASGGKGHVKDIKDTPRNESRRESVLAVVRQKGKVYIKDVSTVMRNVSEKTVQRELSALVKEGILSKQGERRWTLYSLT